MPLGHCDEEDKKAGIMLETGRKKLSECFFDLLYLKFQDHINYVLEQGSPNCGPPPGTGPLPVGHLVPGITGEPHPTCGSTAVQALAALFAHVWGR